MPQAHPRIQSRAVRSPGLFRREDTPAPKSPEVRPALRRLALVVCVVVASLPAVAETSGPNGPYEQMSIRRSTAAASPAATQPGGSSAVTPGRWDFGKIPLALGGVILLILVLRSVGKRLIPGAGRTKGSNAVQVLARSTIGPRQQLMLVQVGRRLVLVGSGGTDMNPLCQIEDPDEVAELIGQIRSEKRGSLPSFGAMFGRAERAYQEPEPPPSVAQEHDEAEPHQQEQEQTPERTREELSGLMDRVRRIASQFQSS